MRRLWRFLFGDPRICPECGIKTKELSYHLLFECPPNLRKLAEQWKREMTR